MRSIHPIAIPHAASHAETSASRRALPLSCAPVFPRLLRLLSWTALTVAVFPFGFMRGDGRLHLPPASAPHQYTTAATTSPQGKSLKARQVILYLERVVGANLCHDSFAGAGRMGPASSMLCQSTGSTGEQPMMVTWRSQ